MVCERKDGQGLVEEVGRKLENIKHGECVEAVRQWQLVVGGFEKKRKGCWGLWVWHLGEEWPGGDAIR